MFCGSMTALITPFRGGSLDEDAFASLIDRQIAAGTEGIVPCGTTGESPTLSHDEHRYILEICIKHVKGRLPVMAGTGSNSTEETLELTRHAAAVGAQAALIVAPYYNKPTQEGIEHHYHRIAQAVDLPIVIYNIPGRSAIDISVETMAKLARLPNIVGVKDSTSDLQRPVQTRLAIGADFIQLSGEDSTVLPFLVQGGHGCISVTANIVPELCAHLHHLWRAGDLAQAMALNERLMPLHEALFCESSPVPVKYAAALLGLCSAETRLPLVPISAQGSRRVKDAMRGLCLLDEVITGPDSSSYQGHKS